MNGFFSISISLMSISKMTGSHKLFQFFQKFHQTMGIYPLRSTEQKYPTKWGIMILLVCFAQILFTTISMFQAHSIFEYGFAFFQIIGVTNVVVIHFIFICESENTLKFIENCEVFIEKSTFCFCSNS